MKGSNPWPAFADMLFMLYVTTLLGAGVITTWAVQSQAKLAASEAKLKGCGAADELMQDFQICVGATQVDRSQACKVSIGEDRLRFEPNKAELAGGSVLYAKLVGKCLAQVVEKAIASPEINERLDVVTIDGFTDCVGDQDENLQLGAKRGALLFGYAAEACEQHAPDKRADILGRIAIRSFGKNRPVAKSPCASGEEKGLYAPFDGDRRVEISFQSRLLAN